MSRQRQPTRERVLTEAKLQDPRQTMPDESGEFSGQEAIVGPMDGLAEARLALEAALDKKALEPVLLAVHGLCSYTNYILMVSGRSDRQVDAIADSIVSRLRDQGLRPLGTEGMGSGQWVLLDFGDFLVHVFRHAVREHYDLEGLWIEAKRVEIEVPADARATLDDRY